MATTQTKFFDATKVNGRVQISLDLDGDTTDDTIDISGLTSAAGAVGDLERVQIERIRWSQTSGGVIKLDWHIDAGNELIINLYGNGHWFNDFAIKSQTLATTDTGDIIVNATEAATLILDLRKIQGYSGRSDQNSG